MHVFPNSNHNFPMSKPLKKHVSLTNTTSFACNVAFQRGIFGSWVLNRIKLICNNERRGCGPSWQRYSKASTGGWEELEAT